MDKKGGWGKRNGIGAVTMQTYESSVGTSLHDRRCVHIITLEKYLKLLKSGFWLQTLLQVSFLFVCF